MVISSMSHAPRPVSHGLMVELTVVSTDRLGRLIYSEAKRNNQLHLSLPSPLAYIIAMLDLHL